MHKTEAIVLAVSPYSESSQVVRLLTREWGAARGLAKGSRRAGGRFHGVFQPLSRIQTMLNQRDDADRLAVFGETTLIDGWPNLRADLDRLAYASVGVELLGKIAEASAPDPFYYDEACRFLEGMRRAPGAGSLTIALLLRLLHQGGFPPQWEGGAEKTMEWAAYDFQSGVFEEAGATTPGGAMRIPGKAFESVLPWLTQVPPLDATFRVSAEAGPPLIRLLIRIWEDHLSGRLKSAEFLEKMVLEAKGKF